MSTINRVSALFLLACSYACTCLGQEGLDDTLDLSVRGCPVYKGDLLSVKIIYRCNRHGVDVLNPFFQSKYPGALDLAVYSQSGQFVCHLISQEDFPKSDAKEPAMRRPCETVLSSVSIPRGGYAGRNFHFILNTANSIKRAGNPLNGTSHIYMPVGNYYLQARINQTYKTQISNNETHRNITFCKSARIPFEFRSGEQKQVKPTESRTGVACSIGTQKTYQSKKILVEHETTNFGDKDEWVYNPFLHDLMTPYGVKITAEGNNSQISLRPRMDGPHITSPWCYCNLPPRGICGRSFVFKEIVEPGTYELHFQYYKVFRSTPLPKRNLISSERATDDYLNSTRVWLNLNPHIPLFQLTSKSFIVE